MALQKKRKLNMFDPTFSLINCDFRIKTIRIKDIRNKLDNVVNKISNWKISGNDKIHNFCIKKVYEKTYFKSLK
jgi:hypothetical protein